MSNYDSRSNTPKFDDMIGKAWVDLHQEVFWSMHKVEVEWLREETIEEIMGNEEENQRRRGFNKEDQNIFGIMEK